MFRSSDRSWLESAFGPERVLGTSQQQTSNLKKADVRASSSERVKHGASLAAFAQQRSPKVVPSERSRLDLGAISISRNQKYSEAGCRLTQFSNYACVVMLLYLFSRSCWTSFSTALPHCARHGARVVPTGRAEASA